MRMKTMCVRISAEGEAPRYETSGASGMDLRARLDASLTLAPGQRALIPTGIRIELPVGYEAQLRARSGLAAKYGVGLVNGIGTIDSDYRGEIKICLINWGEEPFVVNDGDRIAQMVIAEYIKAEIENVAQLSNTERGEGGFGHTGTNE